MAKEKKNLESLNPLPLLSKEIIEKHLGHCEPGNVDQQTNLDTSYIIEANNARKSVIVAQTQADQEFKKNLDVEVDYVHKIRKANQMANRKAIKLPPINEDKFKELEEKKNVDMGSLPRNTALYQKILTEPDGMKTTQR